MLTAHYYSGSFSTAITFNIICLLCSQLFFCAVRIAFDVLHVMWFWHVSGVRVIIC